MPLAPLFRLAALTSLIAAPAVAIAKAPAADLDAFLRALPATGGTDRVFLAPPAALQASLGIDATALRQADPGVACDPAATAPVMLQTALGKAGRVDTLCLPNGTSQGILTLDDGRRFVTNCGHAGWRATADLTVGDKHTHLSTEPDAPPRAPTHACSGWSKQPQ